MTKIKEKLIKFHNKFVFYLKLNIRASWLNHILKEDLIVFLFI